VFTDGDRHLPSRPTQLVGDLHARSRRTDDEHFAARRDLARVAVVQRTELLDAVGDRGGQMPVGGARSTRRRSDHGVGAPTRRCSSYVEAVVAPANAFHSDVRLQRRRDLTS